MNWEEIKGFAATGWVTGPAALAVWVVAMSALKRIAYSRIKTLAGRTATKLDDILIDSLNLPINLFILFVGLALMGRIMPLEDNLQGYIGHGMKIILILIGIFFMDRFVRGFMIAQDEKVPSVRLSQGVIQGVVRAVIFVIGALILLDSLGISITPLVASLGIGTLAVALALQSTLANLFSGLFLTLDRAIKVGDLIQLENGDRGYIEDIGWRSSTVRLRDNNLVVMPNSKLVDSVVTNFAGEEQRMKAYIRCGVHYDSDLDHVEKVAREVAREVINNMDEADKDFEPKFRYELFDASSINFVIVVLAGDYLQMREVRHEMIKRLHRRFKKEGIVIPYPLQTLDLQPKHENLLRELAGKARAET